MAFDAALAKAIGLTREETVTFRKLNTPGKIQDFLTAMPVNFEPDGDTCYSARMALAMHRCHCIEGAFIAAAARSVRVNNTAEAIAASVMPVATSRVTNSRSPMRPLVNASTSSLRAMPLPSSTDATEAECPPGLQAMDLTEHDSPSAWTDTRNRRWVVSTRQRLGDEGPRPQGADWP